MSLNLFGLLRSLEQSIGSGGKWNLLSNGGKAYSILIFVKALTHNVFIL